MTASACMPFTWKPMKVDKILEVRVSGEKCPEGIVSVEEEIEMKWCVTF